MTLFVPVGNLYVVQVIYTVHNHSCLVYKRLYPAPRLECVNGYCVPGDPNQKVNNHKAEKCFQCK